MVKILIVDDNEANLFMTKSILEDKGFTVRTAVNGIDALKKVEQESIDVVISDILMPIMDGYTLCETLKKDELCKEIPVLLISSTFLDPPDYEHGVHAGADAFIRKDQKSSDFITEILYYLNKFSKSGYIASAYHTENPNDDESQRYSKSLIQKLLVKVDQLEESNKLLIQKEESLGNLHSFLSNIINSLSTILICIDLKGNVTEWNKQAEKVFEVPTASALGNSVENLIPQIIKETGSIDKYVRNRENIIRSKVKISNLKSIEYIDFLLNPLLIENEIGAVIQINDITERVRLEKIMVQREKMLTVGSLAAGMAHDFNNHLSGIMNAAELLQSPKRNLDGKSLRYTELILLASERAADLITKLLIFGRKGGTASTTVDILGIIDDTISILKNTIDKKIIISVDKNSLNNTVMGDYSGLQNALLNICINAGHAMPEGGKIQITTTNISLEQTYCNASTFDITPGEYCEIEVLDTGTGISSDDLHHIFEPFYTTKELGKGTGLGLSAVYGTIQDHHGSITVHSEYGSGTTFHILLPCSDKNIGAEKISKEVLSGSGLILLVDDIELIQVTGKLMLEKLGYTVLLAGDGQEAVEIFQNQYNKIDLVIMDMIMPKVNGREAFYRMKGIDKNCKIIFSSGFIKNENINELTESGCLGFLRKPFRDYELSQMLAKILNK